MSVHINSVHINKERLWAHLEELSALGATTWRRVCRLAFSEEDKRGRDYVEQRMRSLGLKVLIDPIGNILGIRPGNGRIGSS